MLFERLENRRLLSVSIVNGGFENGTGINADGWLQKVDVGVLPGTLVQRVSTAPLTGSSNMILSIDGTGSPATPGITSIEQFDPTQTATPGETYTFSIYVKKNGTWGDGVTSTLWLQFLDSDGSAGGGVKLEKIADIGPSITDQYQKFSVEGTVPFNADSVLVRLAFVGGAFDASDGSIFADDATLTVGGGGNNGSISGNVFNDPNSNGIKDGADSNISGWTVYLDTNNNNTLDGGETSKTTDANGNYSFTGLADGTYHVKQVLQSGYRKTNPGTGIPGYDVAINGGSAVTGKDFGDTTNILLAGTVYNDANSNGVKDAGETGIAGVTIGIISNGTTVATRITDANGFWQVKGLSAGSGEADAVVPGGYVSTAPVNATYSGSMSSGQQNANLNFGLHATPVAPAPFSGSEILAAAKLESLADSIV